MRLLAFSLAALALGGCSVLIDVDRYGPDGCDLNLQLSEFSPHTTDRFEVRVVEAPVVEGTAPLLVFRGLVDPLGSPETDIIVPGVVQPRLSAEDPLHIIDFYADQNNNLQYDDPSADHTWRILDACEAVPTPFEHNVRFVALPDPIELNFGVETHLCGPFADGALEVRAYRVTTTNLNPDREDPLPAGLFRLQAARTFAGTLPIDGIVDPGLPHILELWSDTNGNADIDEGDLFLSGELAASNVDFTELGACPTDPCELQAMPSGASTAFCLADADTIVWAVHPNNTPAIALQSDEPWVVNRGS